MICKYHSDRASKLMSQRHSIDRAYIRPCSTSLLNRVSRATGDFKKLEKLLQLARKTHNKRYPSIGVGAFFFISFVLYLANPLHRHGTLPFSAHIETHGNSFALFWRLGTHSRQVSTINNKKSPTKIIYRIYFFTTTSAQAFAKTGSLQQQNRLRRPTVSYSEGVGQHWDGCRSWSNLA
jgi:hypothetical protein